MTEKEFKRFNVGDEVTAYYPGIAIVDGEIFMTPHGNSDSDRYGLLDSGGDRYRVKPKVLKRRNCDHDLLYSEKYEEWFCPFCDDYE